MHSTSLVYAYTLLGLGFAALLIRTLSYQPLFPFQPDNAEWAFTWLLTTTGDYYTSTLCLCGMIIASDGVWEGLAWSAACCLLGGPMSCAWVVLRLWKHGTIAANGSKASKSELGTAYPNALIFYALLGSGFAALLIRTLSYQPLFPFQPDNAEWAFTWLLTTTGDYYTSTLCLCGMIIASDGVWEGLAWSAACCLLGGPMSCAWVVLRLRNHGTIALLVGTHRKGLLLSDDG